MLRILIDMRTLEYGKSGGIENYTYYFIESLKNKEVSLILDVSAGSKSIFKEMYKSDNNIIVISDPAVYIMNKLVYKFSKFYKIVHYSSIALRKFTGIIILGKRKKWAAKNSKNVDVVYYPFHLDELQHKLIPVVTTIHALLPAYQSNNIKIIEDHVKNAKVLITSWNYPYKEFLKKYPERKNSWYLVPYIALQNVDEKKQVKIESISEPYFLYVSFFEERKNHLNLVKAYHQIYKQQNNIPNLIFVGGGEIEYKNMVKDLISMLNLSKKILIYEYLPSANVSYLYYNCEAVISPTLWEAASGTVVEACYCGKSVLCSDVPPLKDFADYFDLYMHFFDPDDIESISNSIRNYIKNKGEIDLLSKANSDKIKKYNIGYFGNEVYNILKNAAS